MSARSLLLLVWTLCVSASALSMAHEPGPDSVGGSADPAVEPIVIDTDIGTDIDDAFAIALALRSPELRIMAITTASGDTEARAQILDRILEISGPRDIPVGAGVPTPLPNGLPPIGLQGRFGRGARREPVKRTVATDLIAQKIRENPGQISLIAIGLLTNVGALIDADPTTFHKLKRVIMVGGWFQPADNGSGQKVGPLAEYNVLADIPAARKLFKAGVPLTVVTLDSTRQLYLDEVMRHRLFVQGTPLTDALTLLYPLWGGTTPVLFDTMAIAVAFDATRCPTQPMHVAIDDAGMTTEAVDAPNANVCLHSDANDFMTFYVGRMAPR